MGILDRFFNRRDDTLVHSYNVIDSSREHVRQHYTQGNTFSYRPDRLRPRGITDTSDVMSIYTTIANDVAALSFEHVRLDEQGNYQDDIKSPLNECLTLSANIDQNAQQFFIDLVISMLEEGVIAVVPVETSANVETSGSYDILSMRVGKIVQWEPQYVMVRLYDERDGNFYDIWVEKKVTAIVENPFYLSMNSPNSTLQRLLAKLALLDGIDNQIGSGKLDLIIQLPYAVKTQTRKDLAAERVKDIEEQLKNTKYGVAYIDATEKVTQLNRPIDNNLLEQIEYLTKKLYNQLNMTESVFDGTADEKTLLNYYNRTINPIATAITLEFRRKFLTKTARTRGQSVKYFRDPFKLVPVNDLAEIADKMTRNEIMSSNEFRSVIGYKPSDEERADMLLNKNLNHEGESDTMQTENVESQEGEETSEV